MALAPQWTRSEPAPPARDLAAPLHQVRFAVVDTETTGGSPRCAALTEIAAAVFRGGERLATFQTLVDPGVSIPPFITDLTGISDAMVRRAPRVEAVLPSLLEFLGGSVVVGHNVAFDVGFLDAACLRAGYGPLTHPTIDTLALARRLVGDDTRNCKLSTLAEALRLDNRPSHRALDDVLATADLLHAMIERVAGFGVHDLGDLLEFPGVPAESAPRLVLTADVPRRPGVYWFIDAFGAPVAVGRAADLRAGSRQAVAGRGAGRPGRRGGYRRVGHLTCTGPLEAAVVHARLVEAWRPRSGRLRRRRPDPPAVDPAFGADGFDEDCGPIAIGRRRPGAAVATVAGPGGTVDALRRTRRLDVAVEGGERARFEAGVLVGTWAPDGTRGTALDRVGHCPVPAGELGPVPARLARELNVAAAWLDRARAEDRLRVLDARGALGRGWPASPRSGPAPSAAALP